MPFSLVKRTLIGTTGWSAQDLEGTFYPQELPRDAWLAHYASHFPAVEVELAHDQLPAPDRVSELADRMAGAGLTAAVFRAPRLVTHEAVPDGDVGAAERLTETFFDALGPVAQAGLLTGVLVQFDHETGPGPVLAYLDQAHDLGPPAPVFVEVRNAAFNEERHYARLRGAVEPHGGAVVATDDPAATITRAPPAERAYFRFHGRNEDQWFVGGHTGSDGADRYDHDYTNDELDELAGRVAAADADQVLVFFNNHVGGHAARNALALMDRLGVPRPAERLRLDDFGGA